MNVLKNLMKWAGAAGLVALAASAQASLVSLGDGTVRDTVTSLIWLQDWNVNGQHNWATQNAWAENLSFAGSRDWHLPAIDNYETLFAEVGDLTNPSLPFSNLRPVLYWSGTEFTTGFAASFFRPDFGVQGNDFETSGLSAVAVRVGDATATVPESPTLALAMAALVAAMLASKRRRLPPPKRPMR